MDMAELFYNALFRTLKELRKISMYKLQRMVVKRDTAHELQPFVNNLQKMHNQSSLRREESKKWGEDLLMQDSFSDKSEKSKKFTGTKAKILFAEKGRISSNISDGGWDGGRLQHISQKAKT
jgi:hypothetical protein